MNISDNLKLLKNQLELVKTQYTTLYGKMEKEHDRIESECTTGIWTCNGNFSCCCNNINHRITPPDDVTLTSSKMNYAI